VARLTAPSMVTELREFKSHEEKHRAIFQEELERRGRRRCKSYWLCAVGGYVLGLVTGLIGRPAMAATTVASASQASTGGTGRQRRFSGSRNLQNRG
jgi:ubiquinone biosynthesis monooxygenase Coq7